MARGDETQVVIIGDETILQRVQRIKTVATADVIQALTTSRGLETPFPLPPNCLNYRINGATSVFTIQIPPGIVGVKHQSTGGVIYGLALPWQIYIVRCMNQDVAEVAIFFAKKACVSLDDDLFKSALPNQYQNGACCEGTAINRISTSRTIPLTDKVEQVIAALRTESSYNNDLAGYQEAWPDEFRDQEFLTELFPRESNAYRSVYRNDNSAAILRQWHHWVAATERDAPGTAMTAICNLGWFPAGTVSGNLTERRS
jgi:hypothetical protein